MWGAWQPPHTPCPLSSRSAGAPPFGRRSLIPPARRESLAFALPIGRCGGLPPYPPPLTSISRRRRLRGSRSAPPDPPLFKGNSARGLQTVVARVHSAPAPDVGSSAPRLLAPALFRPGRPQGAVAVAAPTPRRLPHPLRSRSPLPFRQPPRSVPPAPYRSQG
mgnify:CR=1 FL=1